MKYGQQLEQESVPQWSLHNLDYNSLKHEIRVHTTRDQATAMTIPGHQDQTLRKFEDGLYLELCRQHDRVGLFIVSKADEISRRLEHLASAIQRFADRCADIHPERLSLKRQRKYAKYERELFRCGDDVHALSRFANAQIVAFRKIIKKYKKWTSSTALGTRFTENVLNDPKSFTRRDFAPLHQRHDEVLSILREAHPNISEATTGSSDDQLSLEPSSPLTVRRVDSDPRTTRAESQQIKYWNEYDDGSDSGGPEDGYAIYIDPDAESGFPGLGYVQAILTLPFEKAKQWFGPSTSFPEQQSLLASGHNSRGYASTTTAVNSDSDEEGYASSDNYPTNGYAAHYAFPSIHEQKVIRYRERVLFWGTIGSYAASFVLLGIASVLIAAGRHKLRVEVDAAVAVGIVVSLFCACMALGMTLYRPDPLSILHRIVVWGVFAVACILNGMLLILIVENVP